MKVIEGGFGKKEEGEEMPTSAEKLAAAVEDITEREAAFDRFTLIFTSEDGAITMYNNGSTAEINLLLDVAKMNMIGKGLEDA
jgi:hypothetical protein